MYWLLEIWFLGNKKRRAVAKLKSRIVGSIVNLKIKYCFWEKIAFPEYAIIAQNGYYGLLKPSIIERTSLYYEPFSGIQLKELLESSLPYGEIIRIIEQILLVVMETQEIGVPRTSLILDLNWIFYNSDISEVQMICSSDVSKGKNYSLLNLIYEILKTYSTEETSDLNFRRRFIEYLDKLGCEDIYRIEDFLFREKKGIVLSVRDGYYSRLYIRLSDSQKKLKCVDAIKKDIELSKSSLEYDDSELTGYMYEEDEPTGLYEENDVDEPTGLYEEDNDSLTDVKEKGDMLAEPRQVSERKNREKQSACPRLIRKSTGEIVYINKSSFRLGREEGSVDYCIYENKKVSRAHADLVLRGEQWYIVDLKSKNRTFVNDKALQANVETPLQNGDIIKLDNEEFVFDL